MQLKELKQKTRDFAVRLIKFSQYLNEDLNETVSAEELLLTGSSIGLMIRKSEYAETSSAYYGKLNEALKNASDTQTKINQLFENQVISAKVHAVLAKEIIEIINMLKYFISKAEIRLRTNYPELPKSLQAHFMLYILNCKL